MFDLSHSKYCFFFFFFFFLILFLAYLTGDFLFLFFLFYFIFFLFISMYLSFPLKKINGFHDQRKFMYSPGGYSTFMSVWPVGRKLGASEENGLPRNSGGGGTL